MEEDIFYTGWTPYVLATVEAQETLILAILDKSDLVDNLPPPPIPGTREECILFSTHFTTCNIYDSVREWDYYYY